MRKFSLDYFLGLKKRIKTQDLEVKIISGSMEPFIGVNEKVTIRKINNIDDIKTFDPIVFFQDEKLICHMYIKKVVENKTTLIITKGLNSSNYDESFSYDLILGKVIKPQLSFLKRMSLKLFFK